MTPEQQIRLALIHAQATTADIEDDENLAEIHAECTAALAALARLVAERDEARRESESRGRILADDWQASVAEREKRLAAEGREAALRKALAAYRSALRSGERESATLEAMGDAALAGVPADEPAAAPAVVREEGDARKPRREPFDPKLEYPGRYKDGPI